MPVFLSRIIFHFRRPANLESAPNAVVTRESGYEKKFCGAADKISLDRNPGLVFIAPSLL
jgi:hypothetical protein